MVQVLDRPVVSPLEIMLRPELGYMRAGYQDDLCDCTFVNVWEWKNPYTAATMRFRFCCWLAAQRKLFPDLFEELDGYHYNSKGEEDKLLGMREWDGEEEMPRHLWYRQVAKRTGKPLAQVRKELKNKTPPQGNVIKAWGI